MWARARDTVRATLLAIQKCSTVSREVLGIDNPYPYREPMPLMDIMGIVPAMCFLEASRQPGRTGRFVQWDTARKVTAAFSNLFQSGRDSLGAQVASKDARKLRITQCPTKSEFYERFHRGSRLRMGVERRQNYAMTSAILLALLETLEEAWQYSEVGSKERGDIEDTAVYASLTYVAGLRGEEVVMLSLKGLLRFWDEGLQHPTPHTMLAMEGHWKGEEGYRWHMIPIADVTRSEVPHRVWQERGVLTRLSRGWRGGWYFSRRDRTQARMSEYDPAFKQWLSVSTYGELRQSNTCVRSRNEETAGRRGFLRLTRESPGFMLDWIATPNIISIRNSSMGSNAVAI